MKILMIDDNQSITNMMSKFLGMKGHDVTVSNNSRNGLNLIIQQKFDVVLLDLSMPEFSGADVIDALVQNGKIKDQKVMLFTASSVTDGDIENLLKKGAHSIIKKPIGLNELLKTLEAAK